MDRFRVIKSKGKFYVVARDTNSLAGGPFESPDEAEGRRDSLNVLEAKQVLAAKQPPVHGMAITPGYRSPDVEDMRALNGATFMPPGFQRPNKANLPSGKAPSWKMHRIPQPPYTPPPPDPPPEFNLRDLGTPGGAFDWSPRPLWLTRKNP